MLEIASRRSVFQCCSVILAICWPSYCVIATPSFDEQPVNTTIAPGRSASIRLDASATLFDGSLTVQAYEGQRGNRSNPVNGAGVNHWCFIFVCGLDSISFTTPPLQRTTSYWFRLCSSNQGCVDSNTWTVVVNSSIPDPPEVRTKSRLTLNENEEALIGRTLLNSIDVQGDTPENLTYTVVTLPSQGTINKNGVALGFNDTFTQANINSAVITFAANSAGSGNDSFRFTVEDSGGATSGVHTFFIQINQLAPLVKINLGLAVIIGEEAAIDKTLLSSSDLQGEPPESLTYTLVALPTLGILTINGNTLALNDIFSQVDIDDELVTFTANNELWGTDFFGFTVKDSGGATSDPFTFEILILPLLYKLIASDGSASDNFGNSVSISGDTILVGSEQVDDNGFRSGSAYIFERNAGGSDSWGEVAKLVASDGGIGDDFGNRVAISGNTVVAGSIGDDVNGSNSGSAYIFERNAGGSDTWGEVAKLVASDGVAGDSFGASVAISGDTVLVGSER